MPKITKRFVESIIPHPTKHLSFWNSEIKGFGVIVLPSGRATYCIQYRNEDRVLKRFKLGVHTQMTTEEARVLAKKHVGRIVHGADPSSQKKKERALPTMEDLANDYIERHGIHKRPGSLKEDLLFLKNYILPELKKQKVAHVTRRSIETLHLKLGKTPYHSNRLLALLSKMFSCAISWGWCSDNPVKGIQKYHEEKRDRWLEDDELRRFWGALERYPTHLSALFFKLLLLTGARKGEVLSATWDQFELQKGVWIKPAHLTKQKRKEYLPLSEEALECLDFLKNLTGNSEHLFPGRFPGAPLKNVEFFWKHILREADIQNLRIHDLRHTYASHLVSEGLSLSIVGKLLGHTQAATTQRYAHLADHALRDATGIFGAKISTLKKNVSS